MVHCALIIFIYTYILKKSDFIFRILKGSADAPMTLAGFSTSNKVKNHCARASLSFLGSCRNMADFVKIDIKGSF